MPTPQKIPDLDDILSSPPPPPAGNIQQATKGSGTEPAPERQIPSLDSILENPPTEPTRKLPAITVTSPLKDSGKYVLGKAMEGAAEFGSNFGGPVGLPGLPMDLQGENLDEQTFQDLKDKSPSPEETARAVLDYPSQAPNTPSRYLGALAKSFTENPLLSSAMPLPTAASAIGAQAGEDSGLSGGNLLGGIAGGSLAGAVEGAIKSFAASKFLSNTAKSLGSAQDFQDASQRAQAFLRNWTENEFPNLESSQWKPVDDRMHGQISVIPNTQNQQSAVSSAQTVNQPVMATQNPNLGANASVPLINFQNALRNLVKNPEMGLPLAKVAGTAQPEWLKQMYRKMQNLKITRPNYIPKWDQARAFSSWLGGEISNPGGVMKSLSDSQRSALYAALMKDQRAVAQAQGIGEEFDEALRNSEFLRGLLDQHVRPLLDNDISPEKAGKLILQNTKGSTGGASRLEALRAIIPEGVNEIASSILQDPKLWAGLNPRAQAALVPSADLRTQINRAVESALARPDKHMLGRFAWIGEPASVLFSQEAVEPYLHALLSPTRARMAAAGIGVAIPPAVLAGTALARNPSAIRYPALGGMVGNELFPQGSVDSNR